MTANRVSVYISVEDVDKAVAAFNTVNNAVNDSGITIDRSYSQSRKSILDLTGATKEAAKAQGEVEQASGRAAKSIQNQYVSFLQFEQSLAQNARSANAALEYNDTAVNKLRASLRATQSEAQKLQGELARQGNAGASRTAADLARSAGRGLDAIDSDPSSLARVDAFTRGSAHGTLVALREQAKGLNTETTKSVGLLNFLRTEIKGIGSPLAGIVGGLVGGSLITTAISLSVDVVKQHFDAIKEAEKAQKSLVHASIATGSNVHQQIESVNALKAAYTSLSETAVRDLQAIALEASKLPTTERTVRERLEANQKGNLFGEDARQALRGLSEGEISRAAASTGILRGVPSTDMAKAIRDYFAGQTQSLSGIGDEQIQGRFASEIGKLPSSFSEEEQRLARLSFLVKEATRDYGSAKDAIQTFREAIAQPTPQQSGFVSTAPALPSQALVGYSQLLVDLQKSQDESAKSSLLSLLKNQSGDEQFKKIREEASKNFEEINKEREAAQKKLEQDVRASRTLVRDFLTEASNAADNNPFTKLFLQMETASERAQKRFGIFGKEFAERMAEIERQTLRSEIAVARFQSGVSALKFDQAARRLSLGGIGLDGQQERRLDVVGAQIGAIRSGAALTSEIDFLENPRRAGRDTATRVFAETLRKLQQLDVSGTGAGGREAQAQAILDLTGSIDPRALATSADPTIRAARFARIDALKTQRDRGAREVDEALARERVGNLLQTDARELLKQIGSGEGVGDDVKRREALSVLNSLSEKELTPDLRKAAVDLNRDASRREGEKEREASERAKRLDTVLGKLDAAITARGIKLDGDLGELNVNVDETGNVTTDLLGAAPRADDYNGQRGSRRPGDVL